MNQRLTLTALVGLAVAAGPATAAVSDGHFKGKTDQNRAVEFDVSKNKVRDFVAGVNTYCNTPGNSRLQIDAIANLPPIKIKPNGKFKYSSEEDATVKVSGRITGGKATGKVTLSRGDSYYDSSEGRVVFGTCSGHDRPFKAKLK